MGSIIILDEKTANQIAAGEVIERPSSVVKELVENSIDAGATAITVEIKNGGISYIRVTDNGRGMESDDAELAFERHATSKIRRIEDLDCLATMGFRGEALASIAAVSHLEVRTKTASEQTGTLIRLEGGKVVSVSQTGCPTGTTIVVRDLFYNTPARYKFLKKDSTEAGYVSSMMVRLALAHPGISIKFVNNRQVQHHTPGNHDLKSVIYSLFGSETAKSVLPVDHEESGIKVSGFAGKPETARGNRNNQFFFINGRTVRNKVLTAALEDAYKTLLMQNKFPFCVLNVSISPELYDVNVHPQKLEVRFSNEKAVYLAVFHGVKGALSSASLIREVTGPSYEAPISAAPQAAPPQQMEMAAPKRPASNLPPPQSFPYPHKTAAKTDNGTQCRIEPAEPSRPAMEPVSQKPGKAEMPAQGITGSQEPMGPIQDNGQGAGILREAEIIGQVFDTYIILQHGQTMYLIDQHAAHERIRYETLKKRISGGQVFSQMVLEPYIIRLSPEEYDFLSSRMADFERAGFEIEAFGPQTVIIRSVPDIPGGFVLYDFNEILDRWMGTSGEKSGISDQAIYMMACKSAIKANRRMEKDEIRALVDQLISMENPYTCVHGRPVIISISQKELEKRFKRIV
ncbi:MAG: DNA mismatch repair endonuclease MutL [Clostridiaceae bacterium]|jgi:DNA mismatch repair protein MutL|nr:DNA mismatch repair endonuclease MutL [Clostridiaceae bacterium]